MQIRVDDDMRVIVSLTPDEYARFGGDKDLIAQGVELTLGAELAGMAAAETPIAETVAEPAPAPAPATPEVVVETTPDPQTI